MLRMALVGCGNMAGSLAAGLEKLASRVRVVATADTVKDRADEAAERFQATPYTDYRDALGEVDAVILATPHHLHHAHGMECLGAGKHVFMEKPLANTEQQCLDLIEASEKAGRTLMVGYCMRFHPLVQRIKELLDERAYGEVFQLSIWTEQLTVRPEGHWILSAKSLGGGQLFSHGCHYIDLLLWFLGRPVQGVHFGTNFGTPWMEREGTSNVCMKFEGGVLGYHFGTWGARGTRLGYSIHAHCTEGMIEADIKTGNLIAHTPEGEKVLMEGQTGKQVERELAHFADCVEAGKPPLTNGRDSLQGLRVIWRMYEAEEQKDVADLSGCGLDEAN